MNEPTSFNGWKNWETWNVSLWLQNDEGLYRLMRQFRRFHYGRLRDALLDMGIDATPDGVRYDDPALDVLALDDLVQES